MCETCCISVYMCLPVVDSSQALVDSAWESSISGTLEQDVQETRKMVSALQVHVQSGSVWFSWIFWSVYNVYFFCFSVRMTYLCLYIDIRVLLGIVSVFSAETCILFNSQQGATPLFAERRALKKINLLLTSFVTSVKFFTNEFTVSNTSL